MKKDSREVLCSAKVAKIKEDAKDALSTSSFFLNRVKRGWNVKKDSREVLS